MMMLFASRQRKLNTKGFTNTVSRKTFASESAPPGLKGNGVIGIRREDKSRWERRVPLAPQHIANLVSKGVKVIIQPSPLRVFSDEEYKRVGAIVQEDLSPASTILGVKEVPKEKLLPDRTYMFFSHTIKAQPKNMAMMDELLAKNIRLIDYERVVDDNNNRLIRFGKFAGYAGMIDFLHLLGDRLLGMGYSTPFLHIGYSHMYSNLESAMNAVFSLGRALVNQKLPKSISPLVFVFTGTGAVTSGALEIFKLLPHQFVEVDDLPALFKDAEKLDRNILYGVIASSETYMVPKDPTKKFVKKEFYSNPENYINAFSTKIAPYMSVMVNGTYGDVRYPRMLTTEQMEKLQKDKKSRLIGIAELSCDVEGAIEFMKKTTTIDNPFYMYDVAKRRVHNDLEGDGILFLAVDNLPSELPREASMYFGDHLFPFIEKLAWSDASKPVPEQLDLPKPLRSAVITANGQLAPAYQYIADLRKKNEADLKVKRILILGSGLVSTPVVDFFSQFPRYLITVASDDTLDPSFYSKFAGEIFLKKLDVTSEDSLSDLIRMSDIVISLVPATLHAPIAKQCIKHKKHLVTASYVSPDMQALDQDAQKAGITILNEMGLDPGLDHLSAMKIIQEVHDAGGKINSFVSWCGGLPAPESSDNPLAYKFSWSPRGALLAGLNAAKFKWGGEIKQIASGQLFKNVMPVHVYPAFNLEGLANRDSTTYQQLYGVPEASTMFRGTLRYKGFSRVMQTFLDLGLLDHKASDFLESDSPAITWVFIFLLLHNVE
eukprot:TRINITY_DN464_c0_g1_i1.p1 TRINITY_DN464_c0_g1~~TRINITY_DN464_c0_g1_i1.p1  ORF type:complete len:793 (-),score=261.03 TRINITY_DN464_c0_g1_i1:672-2990(-)